MFPLGTVLFPTMVLPLHVFEPRYRALVTDILVGDGRFGVVLIERGSEIGGDDVRTDIGTVAEVVDTKSLPDGRVMLAAVGRERIRVVRWLDDDPYPRAVVTPLEDLDGSEVDGVDEMIEAGFRQALGLQAELGEARTPLDVDVSADPSLASMQMAAMGPIGPLDQQRVLASTDPTARLVLVDELLRDAIQLLEHRLPGGGSDS